MARTNGRTNRSESTHMSYEWLVENGCFICIIKNKDQYSNLDYVDIKSISVEQITGITTFKGDDSFFIELNAMDCIKAIAFAAKDLDSALSEIKKMQTAIWAEKKKLYSCMNETICDTIKKEISRWHKIEI